MQWLRNTAYILIVILGGGFLLLQGRGLLFPIFFAIFFSFLLMPLEKRLHPGPDRIRYRGDIRVF